jgi:hypothetical protein
MAVGDDYGPYDPEDFYGYESVGIADNSAPTSGVISKVDEIVTIIFNYKEITYYEITYHANFPENESAPHTVLVPTSETTHTVVTQTETDFYRKWWNFDFWTYDADDEKGDNGKILEGSIIPLDGDLHLYAQWYNEG